MILTASLKIKIRSKINHKLAGPLCKWALGDLFLFITFAHIICSFYSHFGHAAVLIKTKDTSIF